MSISKPYPISSGLKLYCGHDQTIARAFVEQTARPNTLERYPDDERRFSSETAFFQWVTQRDTGYDIYPLLQNERELVGAVMMGVKAFPRDRFREGADHEKLAAAQRTTDTFKLRTYPNSAGEEVCSPEVTRTMAHKAIAWHFLRRTLISKKGADIKLFGGLHWEANQGDPTPQQLGFLAVSDFTPKGGRARTAHIMTIDSVEALVRR